MATDSERLAALEAWVDAVTPTLRNLARRAAAVPHLGAGGQPLPINTVMPESAVTAEVRAAVPMRTTA